MSATAFVAPIRRLPKMHHGFDYCVPKKLDGMIAAGQVVSIPFQKSTTLGLVVSVSHTPAKPSLKEIGDPVHDQPFLSADNLLFLNTMAARYGVSVATLAKSALPPMQKRKLQTLVLPAIAHNPVKKKPASTKGGQKFFRYADPAARDAFLLEVCKKKRALVLVPEKEMLAPIAELLLQHGTEPIIWHSEISEKERFERWRLIRSNQTSVVVGTRSAVFLPFQYIDTIVILDEANDGHKHWDQQPMFHALDAADLLANIFHADMIRAGFFPSADTYYRIHKKHMVGSRTAFEPIKANIINMADERRGGNYSPLGSDAVDAIRQSAGDVFLYLNRLGFGRALVCTDCGRKETCASCTLPLVWHKKEEYLACHYCMTKKPVPLACPVCRSTRIRSEGIGIEQVATYVEKEMSDIPHRIQIVQKNTPQKNTTDKTSTLTIGTSAALPHIDWKKTETIVFINIDAEAAIPEYRAEETLWHTIARVEFFRNKNSMLFLQTFDPKQLLVRSLKEPDRLYRTTLNFRVRLGYPPYQYVVKYLCGDETMALAKTRAERTAQAIRAQLTKHHIDATVNGPAETHPHFFRRRFWYTILVRLSEKTWQHDLPIINEIIPAGVKIDPNPIAILHP